MGGFAGTIPSNFTQATMEVDYVRVYQNTTVDTQAPTNFTASVGNITSSSIELLLNADDNSGTAKYDITYNGITVSSTSASGTQKSVIIPNLLANSNYNFSIAASDLAGNNYVSNPILLNATTLGNLNCSGTDTEAQQGTFSTGYTYDFETIGTDVKITFEMLDTDKVGVVAYLWKQSPFGETQMANVSGNTFEHTLTNQTIGTTITYAVKFAFAGGLAVTKYFNYVVGDNCTLDNHIVSNSIDFKFINPVNEFLEISSKNEIDKIEIYNMTGNLVLNTSLVTNRVDVRNLSKGIYVLAFYSENRRIIKKMIIN